MILDQSLTFVEDPTVVAAGLIGDVIDLDVNDNNQFSGNVISVAITIAADITGDITFDLTSHTAATIAGGVIHDSITIPAAQALAGKIIRMAVNSNGPDVQRYLGIIIAGTPSVGTITAAIAEDVQGWKPFPDAAN